MLGADWSFDICSLKLVILFLKYHVLILTGNPWLLLSVRALFKEALSKVDVGLTGRSDVGTLVLVMLFLKYQINHNITFFFGQIGLSKQCNPTSKEDLVVFSTFR